MLLHDVEVDGHRADVRIDRGIVTEIAPSLSRRPGEERVDGAGGALLPGLTDHHLHLHALAAAQHSTRCGPPEIRDRAYLAAALAAASTDQHGWVRGTGYHESVAGPLDAADLDALHRSRPTRIQHRSGALWTVNTVAAELLGLGTGEHPGIERDSHGHPTGRIWRADDWLRTRLPHSRPPDLSAIGADLAGLGITAVTDATPDLDQGALDATAAAVAGGAIRQRVHLLGVPLYEQAPEGTTAGPYKIVLADSALPDFDDLTARIRTARRAGRAVAVHCVTRESLVLLIAALDETGTAAGDRIEHAALVPGDLLAGLAHRRLRIVTQPGFLADRGDDYLRDLPAADHPDLYRCRSLLDAGVSLALSSDAPYGPLDPWKVIAAATQRRTRSGTVIGPAERLTSRAALDAYLAPPEDPGGAPRRITVGTIADLVLLDRPRTAAAIAQVLSTYVAGQRSTSVRAVCGASRPSESGFGHAGELAAGDDDLGVEPEPNPVQRLRAPGLPAQPRSWAGRSVPAALRQRNPRHAGTGRGHHPIYGLLAGSAALDIGELLDTATLIQPRCEPEIVFVRGRAKPPARK